MKPFPQWIKRQLPIKEINEMNELLKDSGLHTVCISAHCPNIGECFKNKEATFLILGNICTRNCLFCSVKKGVPNPPDSKEPEKIADAVKKLGLDYVVITSVTRDDLADGGAGHFVNTIRAIRNKNPKVRIETLAPDFNNNLNAINKIILEKIDVFAHNIETVPRLYESIRPRAMPCGSPHGEAVGRQADYNNSLNILKYVKNNSDILIKSSIILGFGETEQEILETITSLRSAGCDIIAIGQYLKPTKGCVEVREFVNPDKFDYYADFAKSIGINAVLSAPFVRSSYKAREIYEEISNGSHVA
ncbi:MAG: lipoyl synthase [Candidatus Omnitrophica bacterium]|nr:lipoyl synthase [Candidatus Omnitrophota bacterium]